MAIITGRPEFGVFWSRRLPLFAEQGNLN